MASDQNRDMTAIDAHAVAHTGGTAFAMSGLDATTRLLLIIVTGMSLLLFAGVILLFFQITQIQRDVVTQIGAAREDAGYAKAKAESANDEARRALNQADLANWTMMNLEGLMVQNGINVPESLRPKNLTHEPKDGKK